MAIATTGKDVLAKFFDEGAYSALYADGAVTAAFGSANGTPVYAVCQTGAAVAEKDTEKVVKVLDMAAKTGNPVVTFYNSVGAKLEEGLAALSGSAAVAAAVAKVSGVVPQIAVVTGVCGAGSALAAAAADVCIVSKEGELFLTAPFTSAAAGDKLEGAGSAEFAAKAGVAAIVVDSGLWQNRLHRAGDGGGQCGGHCRHQGRRGCAVPQLRVQGRAFCTSVRCIQHSGCHACKYRRLCKERFR